MKLKIRLLRQYRKVGTGKMVFVYQVTGKKDAVEAYREAQGENFVEDPEDGVLYFTIRFAGKNGEIIVSKEGKISADMSQFDQAASLAEQFPGALGQEIAKLAAAKLLGGSPVEETVQAPEPKEK